MPDRRWSGYPYSEEEWQVLVGEAQQYHQSLVRDYNHQECWGEGTHLDSIMSQVILPNAQQILYLELDVTGVPV